MKHGMVKAFAAILVLLIMNAAAWAFDYAQYQQADLDKLVNDQTWAKDVRETMSLKVFPPTRLKFMVTLDKQGYPCSGKTLEVVLNMLGAGDLLKQYPVNHCIEVKTAGGVMVKMFIHDELVPYMAEEVAVGDAFIMYCDYLFWDIDGPGLLVRDFHPAFNYAQYQETDLDTLVNDQTWAKDVRETMSLKVFEPAKLKFKVTLEKHGYACSNGSLKAALNLLGAGHILDQAPVNNCIEVKTAGGAIVKMYIQDTLAPYLKDEIKIGEPLVIYCNYIFWDIDGPGILVNEFEAVE